MNNSIIDIRDALTRFCHLELDLTDANERCQETCVPLTSARAQSYNTLMRELAASSWLGLPSGGFLRKHIVKSQISLTEPVLREAVTDALKAFRTTPGQSMPEAREKLLEFVKTSVRARRTRETPAVKFVDVLPRSMDASSVPIASPYIDDTARRWMEARTSLSRVRAEHTQQTNERTQERNVLLSTPGVRDYLMGIGGGGQPVSLDGHAQKFKLRHSVSTRRKPMRETHVQDAIRNAVENTLTDVRSKVSVDRLTQLILSEAIRLAGVETQDIFSLNAQRGRKRSAADTE